MSTGPKTTRTDTKTRDSDSGNLTTISGIEIFSKAPFIQIRVAVGGILKNEATRNFPGLLKEV